jgi:threonine dehydrogenase-like Zn-dependent dehydrogenase
LALQLSSFAAAAGVLEKSAATRDFAKQFARDTLERPDDRLADVVFDATGSANAMEASVRFVAPAGRVVFVGICRDSVCIDDPLFHQREMTLYASRNSSYQFPRIIARLRLRDVPRLFPDLPNRPNLVNAMLEVDDSDV